MSTRLLPPLPPLPQPRATVRFFFSILNRLLCVRPAAYRYNHYTLYNNIASIRADILVERNLSSQGETSGRFVGGNSILFPDRWAVSVFFAVRFCVHDERSKRKCCVAHSIRQHVAVTYQAGVGRML